MNERAITDMAQGDPEHPTPVQRMRAIGEVEFGDPAEWPDYVSDFELTREHVPELIELLRESLSSDDSEEYDALKAWAPLHAWRALGQLRAVEAIPALIEVGGVDLGDDAALEEIPTVLAMIGLDAIPFLAAVVTDAPVAQSVAIFVTSVLGKMAVAHPDHRSACIDLLVGTLDIDSPTDEVTKGFAVSALLDLEAVEAFEPIRDAFNRNAVDISMAGDLEDVEIEFGLRKKRSTPRPPLHGLPFKRLLEERRRSALSPYDEPGAPTAVPVRVGEKIGRNDPCHCGSGKKYKKCCLVADEISAGFRPTERNADID